MAEERCAEDYLVSRLARPGYCGFRGIPDNLGCEFNADRQNCVLNLIDK
jgi:hypothetical protein